MKNLKPWVKLPSHWIEDGGLRDFRWARGEGSDNLAALMALTVICHHADDKTGSASLTYDELCEATTLSRAKLSAGLAILAERGQLKRGMDGRSSFRLAGYNPAEGWAKFPARGLYRPDGSVGLFSELRLRLQAELDALKLFFLFASRRDRNINMAMITYPTIEEYSGVGENNIRRAVSFLAANGLVHVEHLPSRSNEYGIVNAYRLAHLDTRSHMGTMGRRSELMDMLPVDTSEQPF